MIIKNAIASLSSLSQKSLESVEHKRKEYIAATDIHNQDVAKVLATIECSLYQD